eukprot:CAMPEP_0201574176 /NCGR_PEP_ID=MMETSP0190_2-20130828/18477_1 /ASSEMBLY_ACC=CAM_ASM_000263 /TAXON_ID=37353 /ORGANISM="Rosalina sp." /LENGTH=186 /DNA_ID=CAMNT_0048002043 /DNA_START=89 /DNA_END=649 /DNA_ORIENTATION=+
MMKLLVILMTFSAFNQIKGEELCPEGVGGCIPASNDCISCDSSCEYCQCIGCGENWACGVDDCMTCADADDELTVIYGDGTGSCGSLNSTNSDELCPSSVEGCVPASNDCTACDESCEYCQCLGCSAEKCGVNDCMTCADADDELTVVYGDGTGYCGEKGKSSAINIGPMFYSIVFMFCVLIFQMM